MPKRTRSIRDLEDTPTSRRRIRQSCCWPDCPQGTTESSPMCSHHLYIAHDAYEKILAGMTFGPPRSATVTEPEPQPQPEPKAEKIGVVYYLRSGGYIKIGWASDLTKRMKAYPPDSVLLATHPGTRADETAAHRKFAVHRAYGREWYAMVPALMQHIDRVKTEHGEPDPVAFAAKPVQVPQPRPRQYVGGNYRGQGLIGESRTPWRT